MTTTEEGLSEEQTISRGEEAIDAIRQTFDRWMEIAAALNIARREAQQQVDAIKGRGYNEAFSIWFDQHPKFKAIKTSTRHWLLKCYDNLEAIQAWRATLKQEALMRNNYPETVYYKWQLTLSPNDPADDSDKWKRAKPKKVSEAELSANEAWDLVSMFQDEITMIKDGRNIIDCANDPIEKIGDTLLAMRTRKLERLISYLGLEVIEVREPRHVIAQRFADERQVSQEEAE
jgi:hypothetical protein